MNLPNMITIFRLLLTTYIVWLILSESYFLGFLFFVISGISDGLDGFIAKKLNQKTLLGSYLDPIADKLLVAAVILILTSKGVIKDWDTIPALIILLREITVSGLREYLAGIKISIPVSTIAKAKTFLQLASLGLLILSESNLNLLFIIY